MFVVHIHIVHVCSDSALPSLSLILSLLFLMLRVGVKTPSVTVLTAGQQRLVLVRHH